MRNDKAICKEYRRTIDNEWRWRAVVHKLHEGQAADELSAAPLFFEANKSIGLYGSVRGSSMTGIPFELLASVSRRCHMFVARVPVC
jgi:hypothetical protein